MVSPKTHPFHVGQELSGPHLRNRRTRPRWQTPPGTDSTTGPVCTQGGERAFGHPSSCTCFMLLTCCKQQRHLPLSNLQMCFSASSSEEQTHEV